MINRRRHSITLTLLVVLMLMCVACSDQTNEINTSSHASSQHSASKSPGDPNAIVVSTTSITATVQAVDPANRRVALVWSDGTIHWYRCPASAPVNLSQINAGDRVSATVVESTAITVQKTDEPLTPGQQGMVTLAPGGDENPVAGTVVAATSEITAKIMEVDEWQRTITVKGPDEMSSFQVGPGVDFKRFKKGHEVVIRRTEALALLIGAPAAAASAAAAPLSLEEAEAIGIDAYIYGYPLVTMEMTRRIMTNVAKPEGTRAPMGQFLRMREYPNAAFRDVTAPNADTLYSTAWLDLAQEPYVLSLPDMDDRYFLMPMLDGWTTVFEVPGKRTTGTKAQTYAITGPFWRGALPTGITQLKSPTNLAWILGRTYCTGTPEDYKAVHAVMDKYTLVPLSAYGKPYTAPVGAVDSSIDMKTPVRDQVNALSIAEYFNLLATLMKTNPPATADAAMIAKMSRIGVVPGTPFALTDLDLTVAAALEQVSGQAVQKIMANFKAAGRFEHGWMFTTKTGIYGTDYLTRATIAAIGLGANRPQDAVYPTSEVDADGQPYNGANKYVMHFEKGAGVEGGVPPVNAFWSITMYNAAYFFVENPLNKYTVSPRDNLKYNADGSLDLYIQNESPGADKEANWLPAPKDRFILMLRMYWPKETPPSIIDGTWAIPPVKKVSP